MTTFAQTIDEVLSHLRGYVRDQTTGSVINNLIDVLMAKQHVVLEFGRFDNTIDYMLVANILTRKIHARSDNIGCPCANSFVVFSDGFRW